MEIRAAYSVPQLAAMAGVHRHKVRRLLEAGGVPLFRQGRAMVVMVEDLAAGMPKLWEGIRRVHDTRNGNDY